MALRKQLRLGTVVALAVLLCLWWVWHVPYRPERVFSAIPAEANIILVQSNLVAQWQGLVRNPMLVQALKAGGVPDKALDNLATNTVITDWGNKLAYDQSVIAFMPALGPQHQPAVVFASWIGSRSRLLRWEAPWLASRDFKPVRLEGSGDTVYQVRTDLDRQGLRLSLALAEGLVLGCLSADPLGVRSVMETAEERPGRRSLASTGNPDSVRRTLLPVASPLWGWVDLKGQRTAFTLELTDTALKAELAAYCNTAPAVAMRTVPGIKFSQALTEATSDLLVLGPLTWVQALAPRESPTLWMQALGQLADNTEAPPNALAFAAVLNQDYNGRLRGPLGSTLRAFVKGVKTPTLLAGIQIGNEAVSRERIQQLLTRINSQYQVNLSAAPSEDSGSPRITLIQDSGHSFYGMFEPEERIAYATAEGWLILASNATVLRKLLNDRPPPSPASAAGYGEASAIARVRLEGISQTVRNTAGVLKLATLFNSSANSPQLRDQLNNVGRWADVLHTLGEAQATMETTNAMCRVHLLITKRNE